MAYRSLDKNLGQPIFIVGCARSFTSMIGEMLHKSGVFGGNIGGTINEHNPNGMFENTAIRNKVVKPYLRKIGADPRGQKPLANSAKCYSDKTIRESTIKILHDQGLKPNQMWYYKEPKLCMVWRAWEEQFPEARWIIVKRRLSDIAHSCMNTRFLTEYNKIDGWLKWAARHEKALNDIRFKANKAFEIWPERALCGHFSEVREMFSFLDIELKSDVVRGCINKEYWHYGSDQNR